MLGYVVMASNCSKSGLKVTNSDGSSASDHATVLYLDPVHTAPRGSPLEGQKCSKKPFRRAEESRLELPGQKKAVSTTTTR